MRIKKLNFDENSNGLIETYTRLIEIYDQQNLPFQSRKARYELDKATALRDRKFQTKNLLQQQEEDSRLSIAEERSLRLKKERELKNAESQRKIEEMTQHQLEQETLAKAQLSASQDKVSKAKQEQLLVFQAKNTGQKVDQIRQANDQRQQKLAELQKKKALEEEMVQNANNLLDKAKSLLER